MDGDDDGKSHLPVEILILFITQEHSRCFISFFGYENSLPAVDSRQNEKEKKCSSQGCEESRVKTLAVGQEMNEKKKRKNCQKKIEGFFASIRHLGSVVGARVSRRSLKRRKKKWKNFFLACVVDDERVFLSRTRAIIHNIFSTSLVEARRQWRSECGGRESWVGGWKYFISFNEFLIGFLLKRHYTNAARALSRSRYIDGENLKRIFLINYCEFSIIFPSCSRSLLCCASHNFSFALFCHFSHSCHGAFHSSGGMVCLCIEIIYSLIQTPGMVCIRMLMMIMTMKMVRSC